MSTPPLALLGLATAGPGLVPRLPLPVGLPVTVDRVEGPWRVLELPGGRSLDLLVGPHPLFLEGERLALDPLGPRLLPPRPPSQRLPSEGLPSERLPSERLPSVDLPDEIDLAGPWSAVVAPPTRLVRGGAPPQPAPMGATNPAPSGAATR